ncbi:MAG: glutamate--tRNA ligase, partial [Candidatus Omnitrophica bacterium]|nr:glutamate--tRNA ligase [Candidatus Omnitrophota bacterium]
LVKSGKAYREGEAYIFRMPPGRVIEFDDMIHGKVSFNTDDIKDQVMIKSDGSPAYNFCCVVDDAYLKITHIIRGDDHLSNTPKQVLFYEALGLKTPEFGHMPLIMGSDGAKLSKRHGGVSVEEYKAEGYLPAALVNYLLLLGWSPGGDREILGLDEAVKIFDIKNMTGVQAKFDLQKLKWMNGEYLAKEKAENLLPLIKRQMADAAKSANCPDDALLRLIDLYRVRIKTLREFVPATDHFFGDGYSVDEAGVEKHLKPPESKKILLDFADLLDKVDDFSHARLEEACRLMAETKKIKAGRIIHPTRVAISGKTTGAGLFEMMEILGKSKVIERMRRAGA